MPDERKYGRNETCDFCGEEHWRHRVLDDACPTGNPSWWGPTKFSPVKHVLGPSPSALNPRIPARLPSALCSSCGYDITMHSRNGHVCPGTLHDKISPETVFTSDRPNTEQATLIPVHDPVNHPKHYTSHPSGIECIQVTEHMGFCIGNAVKYLWRADLKNDAIEDLKKAKWYIEREIAKREKETKKD